MVPLAQGEREETHWRFGDGGISPSTAPNFCSKVRITQWEG